MYNLAHRFRNSRFHYMFNMHEESAKGRVSMLASAVITQAMLPISSGIFYTGFLIANGINLVNVGIISFIPYIASMFSIFSPYILERFERRKNILLLTRLAYYIINILGITLLPLVVSDANAKLLCFTVIIFVSGVLNSLFAPGFSPWHLNFIPDNIRADYFGMNQTARCTMYGIVILVSSLVSDALDGSQYEVTVLYVLRIIAFLMAVAEVIFLALPVEHAYDKKEKVKLKNIFVLSFSHKKFLRVIMIIAAWSFFAGCSAGSHNYYLLNTAKIPYTYIGITDASYAIFLYIFSGYWQRFINSHTWLKSFAYTGLFYGPTVILHSFVTGNNYLILMTFVRILQHLGGVGLNISYSNLPFVNLPKHDRTNYIAFHSLCVNLATMSGILFGTAFIALTENYSATLFGIPYTSPQMLMAIQGIGQTLVAASILVFNSKLEPESELRR